MRALFFCQTKKFEHHAPSFCRLLFSDTLDRTMTALRQASQGQEIAKVGKTDEDLPTRFEVRKHVLEEAFVRQESWVKQGMFQQPARSSRIARIDERRIPVNRVKLARHRFKYIGFVHINFIGHPRSLDIDLGVVHRMTIDIDGDSFFCCSGFHKVCDRDPCP